MTSKANRDGVAERCADPAVHNSLAVDLPRIGHDDALRRDVARTLVHAAQQHDAHTLSLWPTVPGIGTRLSLVRRYDIDDSKRGPRVQALASYGRLVQCAKDANGQRAGSSGTTIGPAPLPGACAAAAGFCLRDPPAGQQLLARLEKTPGQGQACTLVAHQVSRAVSDRLTRHVALTRPSVWHDSGRGGGAPDASLDHPGMNRLWATREHASSTASLTASERLGHDPCALGWMRHRLLRRRLGPELPPVDVCCSAPEPAAHWRPGTVSPVVCIGRYEGTERGLGRREHLHWSRQASRAWR